MKILGIDASLNHTGLALIEEGKICHLSTIKVGKTRSTARLGLIRDEIVALVKSHKPDKVVIENYSFGSRGRAIFNIGELGGVIRLALLDLGYEVLEIEPKVLKKKITGNGNASKEDMIKAINEVYKLELKDDNQADALGLAHIALHNI